MNSKALFIIFEGLSLKQKNFFFLEIESPTLIRMLYLKNQIFRGINNIFLEIP